MMIAIGVSLLVHAALLAVRFVPPNAFSIAPADAGLEVILVNAKHDKAPLKADALAQANLDGGGYAERGRAKSPLPDMRRSEDGDSISATKRRIAELLERQQNYLTRAKSSDFTAPPVAEVTKIDPTATGADLVDSSKAFVRSVAEISQTIEDQNKRPRKVHITPSTREVHYALYRDHMTQRIEEIGTLNFPQQDGRKLYGELVLSIPVSQDGTIYQGEGGIHIDRSSGNAALDQAALNIVRRAGPFGHFPPNMITEIWVLTTTFKFTRKDTMEASQRGGMD